MNRRHRAKALLGAAWLIVACAAARAQEMPGASVESLLRVARDNNPDYAGMRYDAAAAAERIIPAGSLPDPRFRTELRDLTRMGTQSATLAPNRVGSTRYLVMQDLPGWGKRDLKRDIAELESRGAENRAASTWNEIAAKIKSLYAQRYYLERNERLTGEILDLMQRLERIAQARYAGGLAAQQDVIRAQVEQSALRSELIGIDAERHHVHARLNALLGRPAGAPLAAPEKLRPLPPPARLELAALEDAARAANPLLQAEETRVSAAEKSRELTYRNRYPDFTLGVSPIQYGNAVREWELMLEMNLPLQQRARRSQEREAEAQLTAAQYRKDFAASQILGELSESLSALEAAGRNLALVRDALLPQAELAFQAALAGYETGKVDFATLLDAQRQIRQARQSRIRAEAEAQARLADIERLIGADL